MKLVPGRLTGTTFEAEGLRIEGLPTGPQGPVTLGFRAEDAQIALGGGQLAAPIYTVELLGESTMVSFRIGGEVISVRAPKDYRGQIGENAEARIPAAACHLFDAATGERIAP